ncbi:MAG: prepilin-type N-terminal cleavage/methylation domain-containing protein [Candidatus Saccharimonas sp.]
MFTDRFRASSVRRGFTIVELLIVIVVIAILAAITIVAYNGIQDRAENTKTNQAVAQYAKALMAYKSLNSAYPTGTPGSNVCVTGASDYCGNIVSNTSPCFFLARFQGLASLDNDIATVISNPPSAGKGGTCGAGTYEGIMYDSSGGRLIWFLKGAQTCTNLGGMYNANTSTSGNATRCLAFLP